MYGGPLHQYEYAFCSPQIVSQRNDARRYGYLLGLLSPLFVIPLPKQSKKTSTLVIATNADMYISTPVAVQGHDGMFPEGGFGCF